MIYLRCKPGSEPVYMTMRSAGADLRSREDVTIKAGERAKVPTGVWIDRVDWAKVPENQIPELQLRARSGLAFKHGLTLVNGIGTVDADFPDEICVLMINHGKEDFLISRGERIAQMVLNMVHRLPELNIGGERGGGFGSTDKKS